MKKVLSYLTVLSFLLVAVPVSSADSFTSEADEPLNQIIVLAKQARKDKLISSNEKASIVKPTRQATRNLKHYEQNLGKGKFNELCRNLRSYYTGLVRIDSAISKISQTAGREALVQELQTLLAEVRGDSPSTEECNSTLNNVSQVTDNDYDDGRASIDGNKIVWAGKNGDDEEIFYYDGSSISQITDNDIRDHVPFISGSNIVWTHDISSGVDEVYLYNGEDTTRITNNDFQDIARGVNEDAVFWTAEGDNGEFYQYDISSGEISQLTNGPNFNEDVFEGDIFAWASGSGSDAEVYLYYEEQVIQVTRNSIVDSSPWWSDTHMTWTGGTQAGGQSEIYLYEFDTGVTTRITNNTRRDEASDVDGNNVVWRGHRNSWEIFHYDINTGITSKLTDNLINDLGAVVSGNTVVWHQFDGNDTEIMRGELMYKNIK